MSDTYDAVPVTILGLTNEDIQTLQDKHPDCKNVFDIDHQFGLPINLIEAGIEGANPNTELLLKIFKQANIRPTQLLEYAITVFELASKQPVDKQKQHIADADYYVTGIDKEKTLRELNQLEHIIDKPPFTILKENYKNHKEQLEEQVQYNDTPNRKDVWEIQLTNVHGTQQAEMPVTVVIEDFIIPEEQQDETFFDSPALVRVVGEYEEYPGLNEGNLFVATPTAFSNGTYITNLDN